MEVPKYTLDFLFDKIGIWLDEKQYKNILKLLLWFDNFRAKIFRRSRELAEREKYDFIFVITILNIYFFFL